MKNKKNRGFILPSHYSPCIDKYEIDLTSGCSVQCCYCSLKNKRSQKISIDDIMSSKMPSDIREKGIYLSPNSDPFSKLARNTAHDILTRFLPEGVPFLIITKNNIDPRTIELLAKYPSQVYVQISISRLDTSLNCYIEPGAASAGDRLQTIRELVDVGIRVTPILMPLFPALDETSEKLLAIVSACANTGAKYLKASYVVINSLDTIQVQKMMKYPPLQKSLMYMTEHVKIHIGRGIIVPKEQRMRLYEFLTDLCVYHGMKFQSCPILDPAVLETDDVPICATYCKKQKLLT